ncbi:aspartate--ammonia ligase [Paenibacillus phyllosphaerae]|uniref:Aspartate--ammonia ligase n=1 Tax=Paenibacillus phyllosphaerae TaxID=274593 RepID=A0A7W5AZW5_9BACL|nr:aspartate--ammonia ligase [Paenibacillus phyllosphaerae]MBB3111111.1 aspartate--ammonia ligase [Paenibacillus phyllosphaerae]
MSTNVIIPASYETKLSPIQTERAIQAVKTTFEQALAGALQLEKVSAPILLKNGNGINDNLNGIERIVAFDSPAIDDAELEIVQSLAKWKRMALARYGFPVGQGLFTDMRAIRRDEILDNLHSLYVDQWDWEKVITYDQRTLNTLKTEVLKIYAAIRQTEAQLNASYPELTPVLPERIQFITTQELEHLYPELSPKEREDAIAKQYGAVFVMQIGGLLRSGEKHDGRSPDYDDWKLNGDIILWYPVLNRAFEVSSMGIRVDKKSLLSQLKEAGEEERQSLEFHQAILNGLVPYSIGGGIGQSRLCMFLLQKAHIGEVQASVWNERIVSACQEANIRLL